MLRWWITSRGSFPGRVVRVSILHMPLRRLTGSQPQRRPRKDVNLEGTSNVFAFVPSMYTPHNTADQHKWNSGWKERACRWVCHASAAVASAIRLSSGEQCPPSYIGLHSSHLILWCLYDVLPSACCLHANNSLAGAELCTRIECYFCPAWRPPNTRPAQKGMAPEHWWCSCFRDCGRP